MTAARGVTAGLRAVGIALQVASGDLLNATLGALAAGESGVAFLSERERPFARHVADAARALRSATDEFDLADGDGGFVERCLEDALAARSPVHHLTLALRGEAAFTQSIVDDVAATLSEVDRLSDAQSAYLVHLSSFVHITLTGLLEDPHRLPQPLIATLKQLSERLDVHDSRLDAQDRAIQDILAKLAGSPGVRFVGNRPRLIEPRIRRPEVAALVAAVTDAPGSVHVVSGMRGVGKSQVAAAVAERLESESWDLVAWVSARTRDALVADLSRIGAAYGIEVGAEASVTASAVVDRLSTPDGERRLVIFDNVERFDDLAGLLPRAATAVVITTTRRALAWGSEVPLAPFSPPESTSYLGLTAPGTPEETATTIAAELGHLPLALTQAATTMTRLGLSGEEYLAALRRQPITSTLRRFDGDAYPASVEAALALAIDGAVAADETNALVERMLAAASFLSEDGFPAVALLAIGDDRLAAGAARATLVDHGILRGGEYDDRLSLHRLFARVVAARVAGLSQNAVAADVAHVASACFRSGQDDEAMERDRIGDTAIQLASIHRASEILPSVRELPRLHRLVIDCATAAVNALMMEAALPLEPWQRSIAAAPSSTVDDTLALPSAIARTHTQAGDAERGVLMYEEAIATAQAAGAAPLTVIELRGALASALRHSGRVAQGIALGRTTIAELTALLQREDFEDRATASTALHRAMSNLAGALRVDGKAEEAVALYDEVLAMEEAKRDARLHLQIRNNRLHALQDTDALPAVIEGYEQLLQDMERLVGEEHPFWVVAHGNLAGAVARSGDRARGIAMLTDSVTRHDRIIGQGDRASVEVRVQLSHALRANGDVGPAVDQLRVAHAAACGAAGAQAAASVGSGFHLFAALVEFQQWPEALRVGIAVLAARRDETLSAADTAWLRIHLGYVFVHLANPRRALPLLARGAADYAVTAAPDPGTLRRARQAIEILERNPSATGVVVKTPPSQRNASSGSGTAFRRGPG